MSPLDHSLQRLFTAAARAPKEAPVTPPPTLEARLLAPRGAAADEDEFALLTKLFRHAVIYAGLVMALSIGWSYLKNGTGAASAMALAHYEITMQLPP